MGYNGNVVNPKITLRLIALWDVAADTRELRTAPHDATLHILFIREQTQMENFNPQ